MVSDASNFSESIVNVPKKCANAVETAELSSKQNASAMCVAPFRETVNESVCWPDPRYLCCGVSTVLNTTQRHTFCEAGTFGQSVPAEMSPICMLESNTAAIKSISLVELSVPRHVHSNRTVPDDTGTMGLNKYVRDLMAPLFPILVDSKRIETAKAIN